MPYLTSAARAGSLRELPAGAADSTRARALAQVREALWMTSEDASAHALLATTPATLETSGDTALADWLYARWWCGPRLRGPALPVGPDPAAADPGLPTRGAARLEAARRTVAPLSSGWLVLAAVSDLLVAARLAPETNHAGAADAGPAAHPDRRIRASAEAVVSSSRPGRPPRPGDLVTLRLGEAGLDPTGGWWWAHSGRPEDLAATALDRWYVHARDLTAAGALVPLLLRVAGEGGCPVSLKCPPTEAGYGRRDALVVYLPRTSARIAESSLRRLSASIASLVHPDVPPLTRALMPGVARAEDPGPTRLPAEDPDTATADIGISYGQLRCRQVAAVAARLLADGTPPAAVSDADLVSVLADVGVDVDAVERVP